MDIFVQYMDKNVLFSGHFCHVLLWGITQHKYRLQLYLCCVTYICHFSFLSYIQPIGYTKLQGIENINEGERGRGDIEGIYGFLIV